jgi:hypothetical protein
MIVGGIMGAFIGANLYMIMMGLYSLFLGKFILSKERTVEGMYARIGGFILLLPALVTALAGVLMVMRAQLQRDTLLVINLALFVGCIIIAAYVVVYFAPREDY